MHHNACKRERRKKKKKARRRGSERKVLTLFVRFAHLFAGFEASLFGFPFSFFLAVTFFFSLLVVFFFPPLLFCDDVQVEVLALPVFFFFLLASVLTQPHYLNVSSPFFFSFLVFLFDAFPTFNEKGEAVQFVASSWQNEKVHFASYLVCLSFQLRRSLVKRSRFFCGFLFSFFLVCLSCTVFLVPSPLSCT